MKKKDLLSRKIIEFGLIGLIIFSPLPAASVHEWSILVIQITVILLTICFFWGTSTPHRNRKLSEALKWPKHFFIGFWLFVVFQLIPLPKFMIRILSPNSYAFHRIHTPDFPSIKFMSLSLVPSHSFKSALALLSFFLIGFLIVNTITNRSQILRMFFVIYIMGVFETIYGLFQLYSPHPSILFYDKIHDLEVVSGTFVNRNHFAGYIEMVLPISIGLIFMRMDSISFARMKWKEKIVRLSDRNMAAILLLFFSIILMSLALVLSRSRTAVFVLIVVFFLFFSLSVWGRDKIKQQKNWIRIFLVSVFIIILFLSFYIGMDATFQRFSVDRILRESRPGIWMKTLKIFSSYPVFGAGLGTFAALYPTLEGDGQLAKITHAHNDFLEYAAELGILGASLFLGGIFILFVKSWFFLRQRKHPVVRGMGLGGIIAVIAILLHGITDFNLRIPSNMLLFSVILSLTIVTVTNKSSRKRK